MIKAIAIAGQLGGFLSSVPLAWGYAPAKGTMTWATDDGSELRKHQKTKVWMVRAGYCLPAVSFLVGAIVTALQ